MEGVPLSTKQNRAAAANKAVDGDARAGVILFRAAYWQERARIERHGHRWIVRGRLAWAEDTGLTFDQYKRGLAVLKRRGLVETCRGLFRGKNLAFLRLTGRGLGALGMAGADPEEAQDCTNGPVQNGTDAHMAMVQSCTNQTVQDGTEETAPSVPLCTDHNNYGDKNTTETPASVCVLAHAALKPENDEVTGKSAKEVMADFQAKKGAKHQAKIGPDKISQLEHTWKSILAVQNGYQVGWVGKQRVQMLQFMKLCPPGKADAVLTHVLKNWTSFVLACELKTGAFNTPSEPTPWFLLKHVQIAINCTLEAEAKPATASSAGAPSSAKPASSSSEGSSLVEWAKQYLPGGQS